MTRERLADLSLRIGLAFAFLYPPINALSDPDSWIGYFPPFTRGIVEDALLLHIFGITEVIIAVWILSGKKVFWPAAAAFVMLVGIVAFNMPQFQVTFRDLSIAAIALYLCIRHWPFSRAVQA